MSEPIHTPVLLTEKVTDSAHPLLDRLPAEKVAVLRRQALREGVTMNVLLARLLAEKAATVLASEERPVGKN